ncbi:MAG TPA: HAD family phosphatase [Acidobacteriaceae bacterium]|jgi:putative hydrolase of the HAD superfamily|nr:HAD family phosphatase [Acidobacteriaceae bacterium]
MPEIRGVLFDYGLVLSGPPEASAWKRMREVLKAEEADFHAAYWRPRHDYDRGALSGVGYWGVVARDLGRTLEDRELLELLEADVQLWTQPNQAMIGWAAALQRAGVPTGVLSNLGDAMEEGILRCCPWLADFQHHTFSHRLRIAKPEAAIYRHAVEGMGLPAREVLFIDDREDNILAAREEGLQAVRYEDHGRFLAELRELEVRGIPLP